MQLWSVLFSALCCRILLGAVANRGCWVDIGDLCAQSQRPNDGSLHFHAFSWPRIRVRTLDDQPLLLGTKPAFEAWTDQFRSPVLGAYAANRQGWPWTQWVLLFIAVVCIVLIALTPETFPPVIKKRVFKNRSESPSNPQRLERLWAFATISLFRPVHMLFTEPIITFICLYVAINFGVLFSFFAAVPYTFETVYAFNIEQTGLVFFSIVIGSFLGLVTIIICDVALYRRQAPHYPPGAIPPEFRLYPAMIGGFGLPLGLFWFAWTSKQEVSWASPAAAIIPYSWGNLCVFVATAQFASDTYHGNVMASASSAMTLSRYGFAGAFPLFILQSECTNRVP